MGALTDSRKRVSADHRLLPSFQPSPPPPSKRPKLEPLLPTSSPPPLLHSSSYLPSSPSSAAPPGPTSSTAVTASTSSSSSSPPSHGRRRLPPPPSGPRHIHGPQRSIRAFGLGKIRSSSNPSWHSPPTPPQPLGLDQYVDLVQSVAHHHPPSTPYGNVPRGAEATAEVVTVDDREDIKQDDERDEEDEVKAKVVVSKVPLYKELYEASRQRDPKLRTLDFEVRLAEKDRLGLERLTEVLPQSAPIKKEVPEPFVPLMDEDEGRVRRALGGRNRREKLSVHEASNIAITREILQCLNDKDWLNDEVINLYLELLKERELREPNKFVKCHFFNTFFYKKLINGGYDYKAVRRWTMKRKLGYNLIDCDKIFVPIHKEVHWCLAVINIRDKKFQYLDSLGSMDMKALKILARYLVDEVKDKSDKQIDVLSWKQEGVQNLPLQENGFLEVRENYNFPRSVLVLDEVFISLDGIVACSCSNTLTSTAEIWILFFGQKHMPYFRRRTAKEILDLRAG